MTIQGAVACWFAVVGGILCGLSLVLGIPLLVAIGFPCSMLGIILALTD